MAVPVVLFPLSESPVNLRGPAYNHLRDCHKAGGTCNVETLTFCDRGLDLLLKMLKREDTVRRIGGRPPVFPHRDEEVITSGLDPKFGSV